MGKFDKLYRSNSLCECVSKDGSNGYYRISAQLSYSPHCRAFLILLITLKPSLQSMEKVSPIARLGVLICVLVATLPILLLRYIRLKSFSGLCRQPQTWIMTLKFMVDLLLVISHVLEISNSTRHLLAVDLLVRFSIICVTSSEVCTTSSEQSCSSTC